MLKSYHTAEAIELGLDEAGRGFLMGPVCIAGVILSPQILEENPPPYKIRDSKKCSVKQRIALRKYIMDNAIAYSIQFMDEGEIDRYNILQATMKGMHRCIDDIRKQQNIDTILVDGNHFKAYTDENLDCIDHECVIGGDDKYKNIAAASILAKTHKDNYIIELSKQNSELELYGIPKNKGYGTKQHMDALRELGPIEGHRRSFKPCQ